MNSKIVIGAIILALGISSNDLPAQTLANRRLLGFVDDFTLDRHGLVRRWHTQVPTLRLREKILTLKQQQNLVFAATDKGVIHCLEAETGDLLWSQTVSDTPGQVFDPAITTDFVYVASGQTVVQLDRKTGSILMTKTMPSAATAGPGANNDFCYVETIDNRISAVALQPDPDDVYRKWPFKRRYTAPTIRWFYNTSSPLNNPPIVLKDRVIFTSENGVVHAATLRERRLFYRYHTYSKISAPVSHRAGTLYIATQDFNLFAVNAMTGETVWRFASGFPIHRQPVPFEEEVMLTPEGGGLFSIGSSDGEVRWVNEAASRVVAVSQERIFAMNRTNQFLIINRADGALQGEWDSMDLHITAYNQTSDRIYQATERGLVVCLAEKANAEPFLHEKVGDADAAPPPPPPANSSDEEPADDADMPAEDTDEPSEDSGDEPTEDDEAMEREEEPAEGEAEPAEDEAMEREDEPAEGEEEPAEDAPPEEEPEETEPSEGEEESP